ncbi:MAG: terminase, partial [Nanoarchaeota archaeon]|nr:terminase [Nanoarchaeota archaeon]
FDKLKDVYGIKLDDDQKRWYLAKKRKNRDDMFREYPSTQEEAFLASIEGAYYTTQMKKVYEDQRIRNVPWDTRYKVDTWWDLGMNDLNVILFTQAIGNEIRFIDVYYNSGEGLAHYVNILREKPYSYNRHVFPHDVEVRSLDEQGKSRRQTLMDLGMMNIRTIERTKDINDDIEAVRKLFSRFYFDEGKTTELVDSLNTYQKEWDDKLGQHKNKPKHNKASHLVDPIRLLARGWSQHMIGDEGGEEKISNFF